MAQLTNSDRHILKATHTPLKLEKPEEAKLSRALDKASFVRSLQLQSGEVDVVHRMALASGASQVPAPVWDRLKQFEPKLLAVQEPKPSLLADIQIEQLLMFGQAIIDHRSSLLEIARQPPQDPAVPGVSPANPVIDPALGVMAVTPSLVGNQMQVNVVDAQMASVQNEKIGNAAGSLHFAISAYDAFKNAVAVSPIGMLHLERIETAPAGIERGELVATIPLAPKETTNVVQKEWTVTGQEFSSIVTDFMENYSEKGVTEKTELSEATESQTKHSQQLGLNASASGTYGFVTFATSATFNTQMEEQNSQKESRKHAAEVTQKASSRVRKERKVTIQTTLVKGKEDTTTRTLTNPSETNAMRIDYFSMMRKWRVRLLQYGLRMTYDIAIPEPGATLRHMHARLAALEAKLASPFAFDLRAADIEVSNTNSDFFYVKLAATYGAAVPEAPLNPRFETLGGPIAIPTDPGGSWIEKEIEFEIPPGYRVSQVVIDAMLAQDGGSKNVSRSMVVFGVGNVVQNSKVITVGDSFLLDASELPRFLVGRHGRQKIEYVISGASSAIVIFVLTYELTSDALAQWQFSVWQALYNAQRDAYYTGLQALTQERDALRAKLEGVDTLTLRREEREEIMKGVLRWLLGPTFQFMPKEVIDSFTAAAKNVNPKLTDREIETQLSRGQGFAGNKLGLNASAWSTMLAYQEMVKFLHQAIEWENLLYLTYPYFWDIPVAWDFVRTLQHPDPTREQFLRAGSARVVLTVRPGYEGDFAVFVDKGDLSVVLNGDHPYLSIGNELQVRANANYPGIPPANPEPNPRPLLTPLQRKAWSDMQEIIKALDAYKQNNGDYPTTQQGVAVLVPVNPKKPIAVTDPWGNPYLYKCPGAYKDYELSSRGADGKSGGEGENADVTSWADASLIAEWYEYTPTHGIDIQVTSALPQMS